MPGHAAAQGSSYFQLALSIKDILTIVNAQYYNSGSMLGCDQLFAYGQGTENFLAALACIQLQSALRHAPPRANPRRRR